MSVHSYIQQHVSLAICFALTLASVTQLENMGHSIFQVSLVYGQMNEPPGARARVALTGLTVAEYFRDQEGQDVLLFIDNIFRFTQAGSEVMILAGYVHIKYFKCASFLDAIHRCLLCWDVFHLP